MRREIFHALTEDLEHDGLPDLPHPVLRPAGVLAGLGGGEAVEQQQAGPGAGRERLSPVRPPPGHGRGGPSTGLPANIQQH